MPKRATAFTADQSVRIECHKCADIAFAEAVPEGWTGVGELDNPPWTHAGLCPRCSRKEKELLFERCGDELRKAIEEIEGRPQCCGECRLMAVVPAPGDLPEYRRCTSAAARSAADWHWTVRVRATDGTKCRAFVRK